jgi:hypothetical protein
MNARLLLKDLIGQDLYISLVDNQEFLAHGEISLINENVLLTTYNTTGGINLLYDAVDISASCIFKGDNLSENKHYSLFFKNAECIQTGDKAKFICKDIIVKEGYLLNIDKEIRLIKLYIKNLDEFIRVTNDIRKITFGETELRCGTTIEPIDIGIIRDNINLRLCFDWCSGGSDYGYSCYNSHTQITPYVEIKINDDGNTTKDKNGNAELTIFGERVERYVELEQAKKLIYEFLVLYSLLTGKNEIFDRIELWRRVDGCYSNDISQLLFSNSFKMNEGEQFSKYSVFNKHSMFPLGRNMSPMLKAMYIYNIPYNIVNDDNELSYELSNDIFYKFFNNDKIEIYKLFYENRFANKYEKFINLCSCCDIMLSDVKDLYFKDEDIKELKKLVKKYLKEKQYKNTNIDDFTKKIASTNNTKVSLLQKITRYFTEENSEQKSFIEKIDTRILENNLFNEITDIRNHIAHGRIHKIEKLQVCTDILELIVYFLILDNIDIAKDELIRLSEYIDFNRIKNNL